MNKNRIAAIDIGSSSIRMSIAETIDGKINILEELRHPVKLGYDTFNKGKIARNTLNDAVLILKNFKKICTELNINKIKAVATTAVREASNSDIFVDNVRSYADIDVEVLSSIKETEYIFKSLTYHQNQSGNRQKSGETDAIVEIGAGTIELTVFKGDVIVFTSSIPSGVLKIKQIYGKYPVGDIGLLKFLRSTIENELHSLKKDLKNFKIDKTYGIGSEIEYLPGTGLISTDKSDNKINFKDLEKFCNSLSSYSESELIHGINIPHDIAENFQAAVTMLYEITVHLKSPDVCIPQITLCDGILYDQIIRENSKEFYNKLERQSLEDSLNIGRSLNFDEKHAVKVKDFSLKIFDATKSIHDLGNIERCYLLTASILHDIGISISNRSHHKHSMYVINAREFFHFDNRGKNMIANIARYHRRSQPKSSHPDYMKMDHEDRMTVLKLASILRIADSLDNSNIQLIEAIRLKTENEKIRITAHIKSPVYAEIYSFNFKKELFEEIFGIKIELKIITDRK